MRQEFIDVLILVEFAALVFAYQMSLMLPDDDPIRLALERLKNPPEWELVTKGDLVWE